jgi:hypothetical protein
MGTYTITSSAELMENYIQADILLPQDKFTALQTEAGAALLFSIGTGGVFNLTLEVPGATHGWRLVSLSAAQARADFPQGATCKTFAAAQAAGQPATIHLAMVLNDGTNDHLYVSLANSDSDLGWADKPAWVACPFNAVDYAGSPIAPPAPLRIAGVFLSEATDGEYLVIDVINNPTEPVGKLARFYLNSTDAANPTWMPHALAADIEADGYDAVLGRTARAFGVDGIYTKGVVGPSAQLIYTPLYDVFGPGLPPPTSRLYLPGGLATDAMAALRNADNTTDLYVAAQSGLYCFASTNQTDGAVAQLLTTSSFLSGVRQLYAYAADGCMNVWGLNGSDEVFYLTCPLAQVGMAAAWSPVRIVMSGVDAVSPYADRAYSANTFFAHGAGGLIKVVKTPATGLWNQRPITLPPGDAKQAATPVSSYTTHITVSDASGQPAINLPITLTATSVTSVYINHLYYLIGPEAIAVPTDQLGTITIVELAHTLAGTRFTAAFQQQPALAINPLDTAFQRNAAYNTVDSLQNAVITSRDGTTRPLIPAGTSPNNLAQVAKANQSLSKAYAAVSPLPHPVARPLARAFQAAPTASLAAAGFGNAIETDLGDLLGWLESGVEAIVDFVEDAATGLWHLVATIAGQVYHGVLNCVEAVVAAAVWIYNAVKVVVEDIIAFLEFLFEWNDILRTHRVLKNTFIQLTQHGVDSLQGYKADIAAVFKALQNDVNKWADIPSFGQTPAGTTAGTPALAGQHSAPANLGLHHYQGHAANAASSFTPASVTTAIFQDLLHLLDSEEATLTGAYTAIKTDIIEQFNSLSVTKIIQKFVAIVADTLLQTAENILLAVVDVFVQLTAGLMALLTEPLDIPVLSWLYHELTGEQLSFLDVICLIGAIPATIVYKLAGGSAPFPANDAFTDALLGATSFAQVQQVFVASAPAPGAGLRAPAARALLTAPTDAASDDTSVLNETRLKTFGVVTGFFAFVGGAVLIVTSALQRALDEAAIYLPGGVNPIAKTLALVSAVGNVAYVSPNIATFVNATTDNWYQQMNNVLTGISLVKGFVNIPLTLLDSASPLAKISPGVESLINLAWNVPVIMNVKDNHSRWRTDYKSLIPETVGNFAFNLGGMLELPIALTQNPETKADESALQYGLMLTYGVCMPIAGGIYEWAPGQNHGDPTSA